MEHASHPSIVAAHAQQSLRVRFEWGLAGAHAIGQDADVAIVVDVLSFTTAVSVAIDSGTAVLPYRWKDESAARYAEEHDAELAVNRMVARAGQLTLSPASIREAKPVPRLVLPSPNGSTISWHLAEMGPAVLAASLRNADAVARWIDEAHDRDTARIAVVAAGEKWPDNGLRPSVEDLWGAGAVIASLADRGWSGLSPEARMAAAAFVAVREDLATNLADCASGRELIGIGFGDDVGVAAELDTSDRVPVLTGNRFIHA